MRSILKWTGFLLASVIMAVTAMAEDDSGGLADRNAIQKTTDAFMKRLEEGRVLAAYREMKRVLGVDSRPFMKDAEKARKFFKQVRDRVGEPLESALVKTDTIEDHFHRLSYLQKFESAALHWQFTFYRPREEWVLVGVSYSTSLDSLYQLN